MITLSDFKYAFRILKKSPYFTLITVLVLGGGLAMSLYTYAVLNTMLYKNLPIGDAGSVVRVMGKRDGFPASINGFFLSEMRPDIKTLDEFGVYDELQQQLTDQEASRSIGVTRTEWNMFEFTRTKPLLGRGFVQADNIEGAEAVVVLSYKIWQSTFAGDPSVVDKIIRIDRKPARVIGVMPQSYAFPVGTDLWTPLPNNEIRPAAYGDNWLNAYARLKPGYSADDAASEVSTLLMRVQQQYPRTDPNQKDLDGALIQTFQMAQIGPDGPFIYAILNLVSFSILLLACVNVGNMLLARTNDRLKETAVRVALGAPRGRLMAQMILESAIICTIGGLVALLITAWALNATNGFLYSNFEDNLPYWWRWGLGGGEVLAALGFVVVTIFLVSILPIFSATNVQAASLLRDGTRGARGRTSGRISRLLVTAEIVLITVVMLVGSAMAIIAYRASHIDMGVDTDNLVAMPVNLQGELYTTPEKQLLFFQRLLNELRRSNDIEAAMVSSDQGAVQFAVDDAEYNNASDYPRATLVVASEIPESVGIKLVQGRGFDSRDNATGLKSAIVSQTMARMYWPDGSALGKRIRLLKDGKPQSQVIVVGVVSDVRRGENLLTTDKNTYTAMYLPMAQSIVSSARILAKHRGDENAARAALQRAVTTLDSYMVPSGVSSYTEMIEKITLMARTMADLFVRCGLFAILLAMTGIYGLTSNAVVQRTQEIGLRRAIGATDRGIIGLFMRQGSRQLVVGFLISVAISVALLYVISTFVDIDTVTLVLIGISVIAVVSALVLAAIYASTLRVVRPEPAVSLRYE